MPPQCGHHIWLDPNTGQKSPLFYSVGRMFLLLKIVAIDVLFGLALVITQQCSPRTHCTALAISCSSPTPTQGFADDEEM